MAVNDSLQGVQRATTTAALAHVTSSGAVQAIEDVTTIAAASVAASRQLMVLVLRQLSPRLAVDLEVEALTWPQACPGLTELNSAELRADWRTTTALNGLARSDAEEVLRGPAPGGGLDLNRGLALTRTRDEALRALLFRALGRVDESAQVAGAAAQRRWQEAIAVAVGLSLIAVAVRVWVGVMIARPLRRLALEAEQIRDGQLVDVAVGGPREVRMVSVVLGKTVEGLRRLQRQAACVADGDLGNPMLSQPLPGPLGQVVHATIERILAAVRHGEALAQALADEKALLGDVVSTIPHLVYWKDRVGHFLGCNDAFVSFRGLSERSVLGQAEPDLGADDQLGATLTQLEGQVMADGRPVLNHKITVSDSTGSPRTMLLSVLPQRRSSAAAGASDPIEGIIGVGADVTLISELERQLAQANRLEAIGQLAAGIAHEINTPIQYIADNTRFVADSLAAVLDTLRAETTSAGADVDFLQDEIPRALAESLEGLQRVADIVRAMKDFSHPGQALEDTDLNRAIQTTVQISRNEWKHTAVMDLHLDPGTGHIPCYPGELKQALLNIVVNAAHAITQHRDRTHQSAPGTITIRTRRTDEHVSITITDDGIGMDETIQARIFDPFFTTKDVGKGTGQGLALARATIVQKHAGAIAVDSAPGRGSTFTITLPTTGPSLSTVSPPSG
jgi:signal transduction histidine kinase